MTCAISPEEFARRRKRLMQAIGRDAAAVVASGAEKIRSRDTHFPFRVDSDFFYLTGFSEPDAVAVLRPGAKDGQFVMFCRARNPDIERWEGRRAGPEAVCEHWGADLAYPTERLDELMPQLLADRETLYCPLDSESTLGAKIGRWRRRLTEQVRSGVRAPQALVSLDSVVHPMRLVKSRSEIAIMRRAAQISAAAHCRAMQACRPGLHEYTLEAELLSEFARRGSRSPAYNAIVGSGANACVLHYTANDQPLVDGDLVLIDAGAEYQGYAADITRTFPVNGRFTPPQAAIYNLVLKAQQAAINRVKPGNRWNAPHDAAVRVITHGLVELGLLRGEVNALIKSHAYRRYFIHRTGHWLGMDVHDVGDYQHDGRWRLLQPGMVLTVEPGIYIPPDARGVARKWRGIGVRIEDDVVVTRSGHEVLSRGVPKTIAAIEALMAGSATASKS